MEQDLVPVVPLLPVRTEVYGDVLFGASTSFPSWGTAAMSAGRNPPTYAQTVATYARNAVSYDPRASQRGASARPDIALVDEERFNCTFPGCDRSFLRPADLRRHMHVHAHVEHVAPDESDAPGSDSVWETDMPFDAPSAKRKKSQRDTANQDVEEKMAAARHDHLERNRRAAAKCRAKRKAWQANLETEAARLQEDNTELQALVTDLRLEVSALQEELAANGIPWPSAPLRRRRPTLSEMSHESHSTTVLSSSPAPRSASLSSIDVWGQTMPETAQWCQTMSRSSSAYSTAPCVSPILPAQPLHFAHLDHQGYGIGPV